MQRVAFLELSCATHYAVAPIGSNVALMETLTAAIARALRMELARHDMSASEFAARIGTSKSNVSRWVNGSVEMRTTQLDLIARGLGMSPGDLVALADKVRRDDDADPLPPDAFTKGDLGLAADVDPDRGAGG